MAKTRYSSIAAAVALLRVKTRLCFIGPIAGPEHKYSWETEVIAVA